MEKDETRRPSATELLEMDYLRLRRQVRSLTLVREEVLRLYSLTDTVW